MPKHSKHSIKFEPQETCSDSRGAKNKDFGPWPKTLTFGPNPSFILYKGFLYFLGMVLYFYTMFLYFLGHLWSSRVSWRPPVAFWGLLWPEALARGHLEKSTNWPPDGFEPAGPQIWCFITLKSQRTGSQASSHLFWNMIQFELN